MAPAPDLDERAFKSEVDGRQLLKGLNKKAPSKEPPVASYEDETQAPYEFVVKDPANIPTRGWGEDDHASQFSAAKGLVVPMIDISPLIIRKASQQQNPVDEQAAKKVVAEIGRACEEWGLFQVVNHGISENLMNRVLEVAQEFFRLPLEEKLEYAANAEREEGYGRLDYASPDRCWSDTLRHTVRPKPDPEVDMMPDKPPTYRALLQEYIEGVEKILQVMWTALSEYLGLGYNSLQKAQEEGARLAIRLNYYPKCPEPEKVLGLFAHKDNGTMTVLLQDDVGGLQAQKRDTDVWVDVKPAKGSLVINIANQLQMLSNGRFNSAMHRALVNRNHPRLSIAAPATPGPKCVIRPLQELLDKTQEVPLYKPVLYGDYVPTLKEDMKAGLSPYARYEINRN